MDQKKGLVFVAPQNGDVRAEGVFGGFFWKKSVVFKMDLDCPSFLSTKRSVAEKSSAKTMWSGKEERRRIRYADEGT